MSHNRYMSWSDVLTEAPTYPPSGGTVGYPSPVSRRPSECFSEMSMGGSRRGSSTGFVSDMESKGHWSSIGSESTSSKSPLANFGFFKNLTGEKKTTRDGQPAKRRGPKPDSKPALTRRQELNRQAQRTHRERKEMYIKALEQEVLRLKEAFANTTRERDSYAEENRRLRELLIAHGISFELSSPGGSGLPGVGSSTYGDSSTGSVSGGYGPGTNSTGYTSPSNIPNQPLPPMSSGGHVGQTPPTPQANGGGGLDYDQIGIDFVLTLERPCMDHIQFLLVRAQNSDIDISGHALMASCPHESQIPSAEGDHSSHPPPPLPDIALPELLKLLDLSNRLPLDGEITPIMAWAMILQDPRVGELSGEDFEIVKGNLLGKIRCYGFGAVLEEFELRDTLMTVLAGKSGFAGGMVQ